jgi:hypothetical protein
MVFVLIVLITVNFSIFQSGSAGYATTKSYDFGYDHGSDDAGISDPSNRYINQPGKGQLFTPMSLWTDTMTVSLCVPVGAIVPMAITVITTLVMRI